MAKLQIPIDDNLMQKAKIYALTHQTTLKDLVLTALETAITNTPNTNVATITSSTSSTAIIEDNPDFHFMLNKVKDALHDHETRQITVWPETMSVDVDSSPPIPERVWYETIPDAPPPDRLDVDPLENLPDEVWKARLEELKRDRGLL